MRRLIFRLFVGLLMFAVLFCIVTVEQYLVMPKAVQAQVNTFCAANLACTVTGVWSFSANVAFNGGFTVLVGQTAQINGILNATGTATFTGATSTQVLNNVQVVGVGTNTTIQTAINALSGNPGIVSVPSGTWASASSITMVNNGQHLLCDPGAIISYTGGATTAILDIGTKDDSTNNLYGISVQNCTLTGNASVSYGIRLRGVHRSIFRNLRPRNVATAGIFTDFAILDVFDTIRVSVNEAAFTTTPVNGMILDGLFNASDSTAEDLILNAVIEGVSGDGILCNNCVEITIHGGTSEGNARGLNVLNNSGFNRNIKIENHDAESNSTEDYLINGTNVTFDTAQAISTVGVHIGASAADVAIKNSFITAIREDVGSKRVTIDANTKFTSFTTPQTNLFYGYWAGKVVSGSNSPTNAFGNVGIGPSALVALTTGFNNTALGAFACGASTTDRGNICLGYNSQVNAGTNFTFTAGSNSAPIVDAYFGTGQNGSAQPWTLHASSMNIINAAATGAGNPIWQSTIPTIAGAGCGGSGASIANAAGTASFNILTGTAPTSAGCTITMPAATTNYHCTADQVSAVSTTNFIIKQTGALSTTSVTLQLFSDVAAATAPTASDTWRTTCTAN